MKQKTTIWVAGLALLSLIAALFLSQVHGVKAVAIAPPAPQPSVLQTSALFAQAESATPEPQAETDAPVTITGNYEDEQGRFQIGILDGFTVSSAAGNALFEAADGALAYTMIVLPTGNPDGTEVPLTNAALAQAVKSTFAKGEGFQTTGFEVVEGGGVQIAWVGRLTTAAATQPMQGKVVARQAGNSIYLLAIAATDTGSTQVDAALSTLIGSLQVR